MKSTSRTGIWAWLNCQLGVSGCGVFQATEEPLGLLQARRLNGSRFVVREQDTGWVAITYCNWCLLSFSAICSSSFWRLPTCVFLPLWTKRPLGPFQSLETQPAPELPVGNRCINVPSTMGAQSEAHTPDLIRRKASEASTR